MKMTASILAILVLALSLAQRASCRPCLRNTFQGDATTTRQLAQESSRLDAIAEAAQQDLDQIIEGSYIVVFNKHAGAAAAAADQLVQEVEQAMLSTGGAAALLRGVAAAGAAAAAAPKPKLVVQSTLGAPREAAAAAKGAAAADASVAEAVPAAAGLQAVVLGAPAAAVAHIRASRLVSAVIPDRRVAAQADAASCVEMQYLAQGLTAAPSASFTWPGCLTANTKLVWMGRACGDGSKVSYTELRAVDRVSNSIIKAANTPCILFPSSTKATWTRQRFGSCGRAPVYARALPALLCSATGAIRPDDSTTPVTPATPNTPTPIQKTGPVLARVPVAAGEQVPTGASRIEANITDAAGANTVASTTGLPTAQQVVVGIIDSGVDATHPDINCIGGASWVTPSTSVANDVADATVDLYGHGTHVAGIVGARNNGAGVFGVAPDVPIYSLKVLNAEGRGTLSSALDAVKWVASPEGQAKGIKVINLSLAGFADPKGADYAATFDAVCSVFKEASDAGVVVVAAAGNYAASMVGYLPASCPTVAAVTSLDVSNNAPSSFSNYLPADASAEEKARVIAAPGSSILSTISYSRDPSGYRQLSGTSMSSPHVAAVAATCIMSGACAAGTTGVANLATIQAAAQERYGIADAPAYGFKGDAISTAQARYYGYLAWAKW